MKTRTFQFTEYGQATDVLQLAEQELPEPGPGQALVRIKAVGLNRSESNYVQGRYIPAREFPSGIGQEAVGEIVALGPPAEEGPGANALTSHWIRSAPTTTRAWSP
jgi:NADPH2:quinone reductase